MEDNKQSVSEAADIVVEKVKPDERRPGLIGPRTFIFKPGERFQRVGGEQYEVRNDGSYRRLNKPISKKKRSRLDAVLRAQGSSIEEFVTKITALRHRQLGLQRHTETAINSPVPQVKAA